MNLVKKKKKKKHFFHTERNFNPTWNRYFPEIQDTEDKNNTFIYYETIILL